MSFKFGAKEKLGCDAFSRVGACGRRPSLSADPGKGPASWGFKREQLRETIERGFYRGGG